MTHATLEMLNMLHINITSVTGICGFLLITMLKCEDGLFSSYSPYLPQSMSGEDLVCIIFCYGLCYENEASGYSFPSEEIDKVRRRN